MSERRLSDPRPSVAALLRDPAVRRPLKSVLRAWTRRDPVDAAEDAGLLALAFERRADEAISGAVSHSASARGRSTDG
jgi:hypothetical protein